MREEKRKGRDEKLTMVGINKIGRLIRLIKSGKLPPYIFSSRVKDGCGKAAQVNSSAKSEARILAATQAPLKVD
jgi:hypothetical protein